MQTLKELLKNDIFAARAGVELLVVEPGYARARMEVTPEHLNAGGVCQGGRVIYAGRSGFCGSGKQPAEPDSFAECEYDVFACCEQWICLCRCA